MADEKPGAPNEEPKHLFETFRTRALASVPALSMLTFVIVAVKVFRASGMETSTTVAIVSTADVIALLKGVVLTLLPGFLAAVVAASIWFWAGALPEQADKEGSKRAILNGDFALSWALVVVGFFTISWPIFLAFFLPMLFCTALLAGRWFGTLTAKPSHRMRISLRAFAATSAALSIGFLTLSPTVWLPLRAVHVLPGRTIELNGHPLPGQFGAYVLTQDDKGASLLLERERAVVEVGPHVVADDPPICIPPPSSARRWFLRASQIIGIEKDRGSPYPVCPNSSTA